jgi:hypothetical protein
VHGVPRVAASHRTCAVQVSIKGAQLELFPFLRILSQATMEDM